MASIYYPADAGFEIDFFPVGEGSRSGDAIVVRFGQVNSSRDKQSVVVVDGGYSTTGDALVKHLQDVVGTDRVDLIISTHPDTDHINGLCTVIETLEVDARWMHLPWDHTEDLARLFHDGRITDNSVSKKLRDELTGARILAEAALERGVPVTEPFTGVTAFDGLLRVLGPSVDFYEKQLIEFRSTPEPSRLGPLAKMAETTRLVRESFGVETLKDGGTTSAENETSVITLFDFDPKRVLLTGDAGIAALDLAADQLDSLGLTQKLDFIQVPHHGSRHNVGPSILDRMIGPKTSPEPRNVTAYVSAAPGGGPKHPSRQVTNAFTRRGARVFVTEGNQLFHNHNGCPRPGWVEIEPLPLFDEVEE
jgi:beta-lactamase superfamily II metal-dependent hydrolase